MYPATVITALYDINSDNVDNIEQLTDYLIWFKNLLRVNAPMVIYISKEHKSFVLENRPKQYQTKIIMREFKKLYMYRHYNKIRPVIDDDTKKRILQFSKLAFLKETCQDNPFKTKYFIWLDPDTFRSDFNFNPGHVWPDKHKITCLDDKFLISDDRSDALDEVVPMKTCILGGTRVAINNVFTLLLKRLNNFSSTSNFVTANDELGSFYSKHPKLFYLWQQTDNKRTISSELACGTFISKGYPKNHKIKIYAIATSNVPDAKFEKWLLTANYYGFDYEILGRDQEWKGFNTKMKLFYEAVSKTSAKYVMLTDCTDVFFSGPADELYDKFIELFDNKGKYLVGSAETNLHYVKGKYSKDTMRDYFENRKKSIQRYPNSGFIIGRTKNVCDYFKKHLNYEDDQAALFDHMYENKISDIDYDTDLIATIIDRPESIGNFEFDPHFKRYKNNVNGKHPVVFHFAGGNFDHMNKLYGEVIPKDLEKVPDQPLPLVQTQTQTQVQNTTTDYSEPEGTWFWWFIAIIILVLLLFGLAMYFR